VYVYICVACVHVYMCAFVCMCVHACVRACVLARVCVWSIGLALEVPGFPLLLILFH